MARLIPTLLVVAVVGGCLPVPQTSKSDEDDKKAEKPKPSLAADLDKLLGEQKQQNVVEQRVAAKRGNLGVLTNRLYNYREIIKKRPDLKVVEKASGGTVLTGAALSGISKISKLNFERWIRSMMIEPDQGIPSYKTVVQQMPRSGVKLAKLAFYQVYAYDEQTGQLHILEDKKMQQKAYAR